ncbi:hypothetical protein AB4Z09_24895 [Rhodococcus sp. TAF43]|uniref:hypothetical protein n=1 Tax=unclassified Rhodococcus (in: high G+C Gram-positive bacteria) TaxID=192944 RepID=UPI003D25F8E3
MADDDDTSAGLTPDEYKRPTRRRASRSAGPANGDGAQSVKNVQSADSGTGPTGIITLEKARTPVVDASATESSADTEAANLSGPAGEAASDDRNPVASTEPGRSRGALAAMIAVGLVIVALLGVGGWLVFERMAANDRDARREAFMGTAQQTVLNLTTIKPETAKEDVEKILAGASGEFKSEFDGREDPFVSIVKEAGVTTVGRIVASGIESDSEDTAKVLVSARADVTTPDGAQNGTRDFRMRVTVTDNDGTLTASKVEFVP